MKVGRREGNEIRERNTRFPTLFRCKCCPVNIIVLLFSIFIPCHCVLTLLNCNFIFCLIPITSITIRNKPSARSDLFRSSLPFQHLVRRLITRSSFHSGVSVVQSILLYRCFLFYLLLSCSNFTRL